MTNVPKKNTRHKSTKNVICIFLYMLFLAVSTLDCLVPDCWHDHKTPNIRWTGKAHILLGVRKKRSLCKEKTFLTFLWYDFVVVFQWGRHVILFWKVYFVSQWWCSIVRPKCNQVHQWVQEEITAIILGNLRMYAFFKFIFVGNYKNTFVYELFIFNVMQHNTHQRAGTTVI